MVYVVKTEGMTRYSTGKRCRNGHLAERYTSTGNCVVCVRTVLPRVTEEATASGAPGFVLRVRPEHVDGVRATGWWIRHAPPDVRYGRRTLHVEAPHGTTLKQVAAMGRVLGWWS